MGDREGWSPECSEEGLRRAPLTPWSLPFLPCTFRQDAREGLWVGGPGGGQESGSRPGSKSRTPGGVRLWESHSTFWACLPFFWGWGDGIIARLRSSLPAVLIKNPVWGVGAEPLGSPGWLCDHPEFLALSGPLASTLNEVVSR